MPRRETHVVINGDGNNIASANTSDNTVTINGVTYELPADGSPLVVDGNRVDFGRRSR